MASRLKITSRILFILYLAAVVVVCFGHFENLPDIEKKFLGIPMDKVIHFIMFLPFPILMGISFHKTSTKSLNTIFFTLGTFVLGCILAGATEIGQSFTTYRSCDITDFRADSIALAISTLAVFIVNILRNKRN
jgi:VanZ family protein